MSRFRVFTLFIFLLLILKFIFDFILWCLIGFCIMSIPIALNTMKIISLVLITLIRYTPYHFYSYYDSRPRLLPSPPEESYCGFFSFWATHNVSPTSSTIFFPKKFSCSIILSTNVSKVRAFN